MYLKNKFLRVFLGCIMLFGLLSSPAFANEPELTLHPNSGQIDLNQSFAVDVLVDTKGQEVALVRAVLKFDPEMVQVENAERNDDIFCQWPENEQLIDNEMGIVMATGFCQSGVDELYSTGSEPEVMIRLTFTTLKAGTFTIDWEHTGIDEPMNSAIITDGSPPQNILNVIPSSGEYSIVIPTQPKTPETGIAILENLPSTIVVGSTIFLLAFAANFFLDPKRRYFSKSRTVVVYDDEKK